jgi:flagellar protein FliS
MWQNAQSAYFESRILSAEPLELVRILYRSAMESVGDARRHLAAKEIRERAKALSKASEILLELTASLDFERGGEISRQLAALYEYMLLRLTEANLKQNDEILAEVLGLLATLLEGWEGISQNQEAAEPAAPVWAQPQETVTASASHAWSL